jgi:hypothetical protein
MFMTLCLAAACLFMTSRLVSAQKASGAAGGSKVPRQADGRPDLEGVWDFRSLTPLQRPPELGNKAVLTAEEAAALERSAASASAARPSTPGDVGSYNNFWVDSGPKTSQSRRTSIIVDPADGRLPPVVPGAFRQVGSYMEANMPGEPPVRYRGGGLYPEGAEYRGLAERCLVGFNAGPPVLPGGYNQNIQIFQSSAHVAILHEMVHDARIVPLDGRPHLPDSVRQWMGDARGRWEGDTLVIESTNFTDKTLSFNDTLTSGMGTGKTLHLTERLRRIEADTLEYEFTVNDPATFTRPFTGIIPMKKSNEPIFEFACHEGNYALRNILAGARQKEQAESQAPKKK